MTGQYNNCPFVPAYSGNFREGRIATIDRLIIHATQSDRALAAIQWFADPEAEVSAHYVVDTDGSITQCVKEEDTAWAAPLFNARGLHIEHAGWVDKSVFPDAQLRASAALVTHLGDKYGIPRDRAHILGHSELPNQTHKDPGHTWPWEPYMVLVAGAAARFWNHPDGIVVANHAAFSLAWPQGAAHCTIMANGKYPIWEGGPQATVSLSFNTPGAHTLTAMATDASGRGLGASTLVLTVKA